MNKTEEYYLYCLIDECSEVIQEAMKCLKFGADETYYKYSESNREKLEREITDLIGAIENLKDHKIIKASSQEDIDAKKEKIKRFLEVHLKLTR